LQPKLCFLQMVPIDSDLFGITRYLQLYIQSNLRIAFFLQLIFCTAFMYKLC
jgi:hypothetical protein